MGTILAAISPSGMGGVSSSTASAPRRRTMSGRQVARARITAANASASNSPGTMPAVKSSPTDWFDRKPYRIINRLGGISMPSTDEPATTPTAKRGW